MKSPDEFSMILNVVTGIVENDLLFTMKCLVFSLWWKLFFDWSKLLSKLFTKFTDIHGEIYWNSHKCFQNSFWKIFEIFDEKTSKSLNFCWKMFSNCSKIENELMKSHLNLLENSQKYVALQSNLFFRRISFTNVYNCVKSFLFRRKTRKIHLIVEMSLKFFQVLFLRKIDFIPLEK